jgi:hypothetical protein
MRLLVGLIVLRKIALLAASLWALNSTIPSQAGIVLSDVQGGKESFSLPLSFPAPARWCSSYHSGFSCPEHYTT